MDRARKSLRLAQPVVEAEGAGAESHDLKQSAGDGDVLQEVDKLVLIGEIAVEADGGSDREYGHDQGHKTGAIPDDQEQAAEQFAVSATPYAICGSGRCADWI